MQQSWYKKIQNWFESSQISAREWTQELEMEPDEIKFQLPQALDDGRCSLSMKAQMNHLQ